MSWPLKIALEFGLEPKEELDRTLLLRDGFVLQAFEESLLRAAAAVAGRWREVAVCGPGPGAIRRGP